MAAAFLKAPELELTDDEARKLGAAVADVEKHYTLPALSPEKRALVGLGIVAFSIYVPRVRAIAKRRGSDAPQLAPAGAGKGNPHPNSHSSGPAPAPAPDLESLGLSPIHLN